MPEPPTFNKATKPSQILELAGQWLAAELGSDFRWNSARHALLAMRGGRTCELSLQPSTWNRAGELTSATLRVTVRDKALAGWRRRQAEGSLLGASARKGSADVVWSNEFINVDPDLYFVDLFGDIPRAGTGVRSLSLSELLHAIRQKILPKLDLFDSPARVAKELPDTWLVLTGNAVEWAISLDDRESARAIATRTMKVHPERTDLFEKGGEQHEARKRPIIVGDESAIGWLAARHELFSDREPLPWTLAPESEHDVIVALGRDLLEVLRADLRHLPEYREGKLTDVQLSEAMDLVRRWLAELTDPAGQSEQMSDSALTDRANNDWPSGTLLGHNAKAFEAAAARMRRRTQDT